MIVLLILVGLGALGLGILLGTRISRDRAPVEDAAPEYLGSPEYQRLCEAQRRACMQQQSVSEEDFKVLSKAIADIASGQVGGKIGLGFHRMGDDPFRY